MMLFDVFFQTNSTGFSAALYSVIDVFEMKETQFPGTQRFDWNKRSSDKVATTKTDLHAN